MRVLTPVRGHIADGAGAAVEFMQAGEPAPLGIARNVVPRPDIGQLRTGEIVVALMRRGRRRTAAGVGLDPGARRAREIAGQTKIRPAVRPGDSFSHSQRIKPSTKKIRGCRKNPDCGRPIHSTDLFFKIHMVDPTVGVMKVVSHDAPLPASYFGPPEQFD